jgi:hypothetical protein
LPGIPVISIFRMTKHDLYLLTFETRRKHDKAKWHVCCTPSSDEDKIAVGGITQCSIYITNLSNRKI